MLSQFYAVFLGFYLSCETNFIMQVHCVRAMPYGFLGGLLRFEMGRPLNKLGDKIVSASVLLKDSPPLRKFESQANRILRRVAIRHGIPFSIRSMVKGEIPARLANSALLSILASRTCLRLLPGSISKCSRIDSLQAALGRPYTNSEPFETGLMVPLRMVRWRTYNAACGRLSMT